MLTVQPQHEKHIICCLPQTGVFGLLLGACLAVLDIVYTAEVVCQCAGDPRY